jgi:hypothetical protein
VNVRQFLQNQADYIRKHAAMILERGAATSERDALKLALKLYADTSPALAKRIAPLVKA